MLIDKGFRKSSSKIATLDVKDLLYKIIKKVRWITI